MEVYTVFRESNPKNKVTIKAVNIDNLRKKLANYIDARPVFRKKPAESIIVGKIEGGKFKKLGEMYLDLYHVLSLNDVVVWQISNKGENKYYLVSKKTGTISRREPYKYSKSEKRSPEYKKRQQWFLETLAPTRRTRP